MTEPTTITSVDHSYVFAEHMAKNCGMRIDFHWHAISDHLTDEARGVLEGFLRCVERGEG